MEYVTCQDDTQPRRQCHTSLNNAQADVISLFYQYYRALPFYYNIYFTFIMQHIRKYYIIDPLQLSFTIHWMYFRPLQVICIWEQLLAK